MPVCDRWHAGGRCYDSGCPPTLPNTFPGGRPLDQDEQASKTERPAAESGHAARGDAPPGLRAQLGATKAAVVALLRAHVDLAKAEADQIKGEVARAALFAGIAFACLFLLGFLLPIGLILFTGEWVFGSIGWGLLHGTEMLIAIAVLAVLLALRTRGLLMDLLIAAVIGLVASVILGPNLPNELWRRLGDALNLGDAAWRPLASGVLAMAVVGALVGVLLGARAGGGGPAVGGLVAGAVLGALIGAFSAITFGWRVGVALGITIGLAAWPILMGVTAARAGIDTDALKARFWPQTTIDTTKETIEWAKARSPLGPTS